MKLKDYYKNYLDIKSAYNRVEINSLNKLLLKHNINY